MRRMWPLIVAVGVLGLVPAGSMAKTKRHCGPRKAHTVKTNRYGRVYNYRFVVYACAYNGGKPRALGDKYDCSSPSTCGGVNGVKLSGRWVGVAEFQSDGATTVSSV